jgi:hypothetical protein
VVNSTRFSAKHNFALLAHCRRLKELREEEILRAFVDVLLAFPPTQFSRANEKEYKNDDEKIIMESGSSTHHSCRLLLSAVEAVRLKGEIEFKSHKTNEKEKNQIKMIEKHFECSFHTPCCCCCRLSFI